MILRGQGLRSGSGPGVPITGSGPLRQRVNARHLLRCHAVRVGRSGGCNQRGKPFRRSRGVHGVPAGWALAQQAGHSHAVAFGGPQARVLGRAGGGLGDAAFGSAGDGSGSPMLIRQHVSQYIQVRTAGLCPHRMHRLVIIRRPAWRLGPVGAGRRSDTPRRTEPASRRRPSTSDTATPGRRSPPPRGPRLTGRATW